LFGLRSGRQAGIRTKQINQPDKGIREQSRNDDSVCSGDLVAQTEVIEIRKATGSLGCVVEPTEAIAHEVRNRVTQLQFRADGRPRLAIKAGEEPRLVRAILEIALGLQIHPSRPLKKSVA
jgi:hypothetical protein